MLRFAALDGFELGGAFYEAPGGEPLRAAVIHGGAGIPSARYRHLAAFLAVAGIPTLTYDYRGIGLSRPQRLRGFQATMEDWSEFDCAGAVAWLRARFPRARITGIAHSIGALLFGGAANASEHDRLVLVGAHTGYYGDYRASYRLLMAAVWHGLMPAVTHIAGYFPGSRLRLGEDLPRGVALQWAGRRAPDLRGASTAGPRLMRLLENCAALRQPALVVGVSDDAFATPAGEQRLLSYYPGLRSRHVAYTPADAGVARIGHLGFFARPVGAALWPRLRGELEAAEGPGERSA